MRKILRESQDNYNLPVLALTYIYAVIISLIFARQVAQGYGRWYALWAWLLALLVSAVLAVAQFFSLANGAVTDNLSLLGGLSWLGVVSLGTLASSYVRGLRFELPDTRTSQFLVFALSLLGLLMSLFGIARMVIGVI